MSEPILLFDNCTMRFGGVVAVCDVTLRLEENDLIGLIGPNGAGKTTVFNMITGVYQPTNGGVMYGGRNIVGLKPHQIAKLGIARTFQNIRLFKSLTVFETVQVPMIMNIGYGFGTAVTQLGKYRSNETEVRSRITELLEIFDLRRVENELATSLPYGEQRRVEIVRALATSPRLLLLDEPAAGMNPSEKVELMSLIKSIKSRFNLAILLIEHDMRVVMGICEKITVLDYGLRIAEGTPQEIQRHPKVIEAYLGEQV